MKVLIASVSNKPHRVFMPHFESILALEGDVEAAYAYISDGMEPESEKMVHDAGGRVAEALPKPLDATYAVTEVTHEWSLPTFNWLANEKDRLFDLAREEKFDAIFYVDSDLVLAPDTLTSLIATEKSLVSAVFWTMWQPNAPPLPQVWMRHPYEFDGKGMRADELLRRLYHRDLVQVGGLGACTLIRSDVFSKLSWNPPIEGLPSHGMWQGEDRHFCVRAARNHVAMWADAWPDIFHLYRDSDVDLIEEWRASLPERPKTPRRGDEVSFAIETVEEKELHGRKEQIRGVLGSLKVVPEIEEALMEMEVGEKRAVKILFPSWWPIEAYRNQQKYVFLKLLGVKRV